MIYDIHRKYILSLFIFFICIEKESQKRLSILVLEKYCLYFKWFLFHALSLMLALPQQSML